jgi:hypothetical protein
VLRGSKSAVKGGIRVVIRDDDVVCCEELNSSERVKEGGKN